MDRPVPMELFGSDHWSTFAYAETCVVDRGGVLRFAKMRTDAKRHPLFLERASSRSGHEYPTRLGDGSELRDHDDWDCLYDLQQVGLLRIRQPTADNVWVVEPGKRGPLLVRNQSNIAVKVALTERGWDVAGQLRRHVADKGATYRDFSGSLGREDYPTRTDGAEA